MNRNVDCVKSKPLGAEVTWNLAHIIEQKGL